MNNRSKQRIWPLVVIGSAIALGTLIYKSINKKEQTNNHSKIQIKSTNKVSLVVNKNIIEQGLPLGLFLAQFPQLTIIVCPDADESTNRQLKSQVPIEHSFKLIPCETVIGITHVLKHLRAEQVILAPDTPVESKDIQNFVGTVIQLNEKTLDEQIKQILA